jgi:hypothetical protein
MNALEKATVVSERRKSPRQRALKKAQIVFKDGNCTMNCQVVEVSGSGAKIIPDDPFSLPDQFFRVSSAGVTRSRSQTSRAMTEACDGCRCRAAATAHAVMPRISVRPIGMSLGINGRVSMSRSRERAVFMQPI